MPTASRVVPRKSGHDQKTRHIASLDGLRAISILLVLLGHLHGTRGMPSFDLRIGDYAHLGVVVFFVISGFLITSLLISEHAQKGRVSLKLFYARRALRIFPASYAYVACVSLLAAGGLAVLNARDIWHAVTYTVNYYPARSWVIGHLWSLSVEEQFYLIWPLTFVLLGPWRSRWVTAGTVCLLGPAARLSARLFLQPPYRDLEMFPMVADSLAAGCCLAQLRPWLETQSWYLWLLKPAPSATMVAIILVLNRYMSYSVISIFGFAFTNVAVAILVHRSVFHPDDWAGRILNWNWLAFVGTLSYSLYVWQQLFLDRHSDAWVNAFPQNLVLTCCVALISYLALEMPLMKLRHRLRA
jgi:peptidoglycan/LPS O-acetylase OafA/YrhL